MRLGDVAQIESGSEEINSLTRYNSEAAIFIGIYPSPGANEIAVADALKRELAAINETLPP